MPDGKYLHLRGLSKDVMLFFQVAYFHNFPQIVLQDLLET